MGKISKQFFHTQETRSPKISSPIKCTRDNAWLGDAYYFWYDCLDAEHWGNTSKRSTGSFDIYVADIDSENILDTVFSEEEYLFWLKQVEKAAKKIIKSTGQKPSIKEINDYFKERAYWDDVDGVLFQDLPTNQNHLLIASFFIENAFN
jgi:hypothetical protein